MERAVSERGIPGIRVVFSLFEVSLFEVSLFGFTSFGFTSFGFTSFDVHVVPLFMFSLIFMPVVRVFLITLH
ncbi:hypothetical protein YDYSY3_50650 [Paenibacillus chitinolyticus]|nr:hypothetical protein YDYSY3_50650 [Paenibacillus chitinolyticus]